MIKNIVFDMGGVLIDYSFPKKAREAARNEDEYNFFIKEIYGSVEWAQADRGIISFADAIKKCQKRLPELTDEQVNNILNTAHNPMPETEGMFELVSTLKKNSYNVYILSNAPNTYHDFINRARIFDLFENKFFSCDYKMLKPEREIYIKFLEKYNLIPNECVFIDDSKRNIEAGIFAGMYGIVFYSDMNRLKNNLIELGINLS